MILIINANIQCHFTSGFQSFFFLNVVKRVSNQIKLINLVALNSERHRHKNVGGVGVSLPKGHLEKKMGYLGQHFVRFEDSVRKQGR